MHLAPPLGMTTFEFRKVFWCQKTKVPALSAGVVCVIHPIMFSRFSRTPSCDRQTHTNRHRQTHDHGVYHESIARAIKTREHRFSNWNELNWTLTTLCGVRSCVLIDCTGCTSLRYHRIDKVCIYCALEKSKQKGFRHFFLHFSEVLTTRHILYRYLT